MIGLKILGLVSVILLGIGAPIVLLTDDFKKKGAAQFDRNGKRKRKIDSLGYWDYLAIFFSVGLLLVGLVTHDREEKLTSLMLLGFGYSFVLLAAQDNYMVVPLQRRIAFVSCLTLAMTSYGLSLINYNFRLQSGVSCLTTLLFPLITYIYLFAARQIIKLTTNTYPLTVSKWSPVGGFSARHNRKATYWDQLWSLWNFFGFLALLVYFFFKAGHR